MTLEVGKPYADAIAEVNASADIFEWNAEETKGFMDRQSRVDLKTHVS